MRILIADDEPISRRLLEVTLQHLGHEVLQAQDGVEAWELLSRPDSPRLVVLDWLMPRMDGLEVCRRVRARENAPYVYVVLVVMDRRQDVVAGLESGADDFITKPYAAGELAARLRTGERILKLEATLQRKLDELQDAMAHVRQLQGLLSICMYCKRIRSNSDWQALESYIESHSDAVFSHAICEECLEHHYPEPESQAHR